MLKFRLLKAGEIDCRIAMVSEKGVVLLLYKDARCDMNILDETVGAECWQRKHEVINGKLFCSVAIRSTSGDWVWKQDVGTESFAEKEKGEASDSFKRACFNWGIGRELYTAPFLWFPGYHVNTQEINGKWMCRDRFRVSFIEYEDRKIARVGILNEDTGTILSFEKPSQTKASNAQKNTITEICKDHNINLEAWLLQNKMNWDNLTREQSGYLLSVLKKKYGDE